MNELDLPAAPPLPHEVRLRVLDIVLEGLDQPEPRRRLPRWAPLLTAAAVVLVTITVAALITVAGSDPDPAAPATGVPTPAPRSADETPQPTGDPIIDAALTRCADAVLGIDYIGRYPPPGSWRPTAVRPGNPLELRLSINNWFACLTTPDRVVLSPVDDRASGQRARSLSFVTRMAPNLVAVYNTAAGGVTYEFDEPVRIDGAGLAFVEVDDPDSLIGTRVVFHGDEWAGVGAEATTLDQLLSPGLEVVNRPLPHRTDTNSDDAALTDCLAGIPSINAYRDPTLWTTVAYHDHAEQGAVLARIGDVAAGFCLLDPEGGPVFTGAPLPPPGDLPQPVVTRRDTVAAMVFTAPQGVTGMSITSSTVADGTTSAMIVPCTVADGLALCVAGEPVGGEGGQIVVSAVTVDHPGGIEVFRG